MFVQGPHYLCVGAPLRRSGRAVGGETAVIPERSPDDLQFLECLLSVCACLCVQSVWICFLVVVGGDIGRSCEISLFGLQCTTSVVCPLTQRHAERSTFVFYYYLLVSSDDQE